MFQRWAALLLVPGLCAMKPENAAGQTQTPPLQTVGSLGKNFPNPFNLSTSIRFAVDTVGGCLDGKRQHAVTLRVVNALSRPVAHFIVQRDPDSITSVSKSLSGQRLENLKLGCGVYVGFWDGNLPNGKEAASGVYLAQFYIDGKFHGAQKMLK